MCLCVHAYEHMHVYVMYARALSRSFSLPRSLALPGSDFYSHACVQAPTHAHDTHFEETSEGKSATSTQKSGALLQTLRVIFAAMHLAG